MNHKNKLIKYLLVLLLTFAFLSIISIVDEVNGVKIFNIGIGIENYVVLLFSLLSMIKILFDLNEV